MERAKTARRQRQRRLASRAAAAALLVLVLAPALGLALEPELPQEPARAKAAPRAAAANATADADAPRDATPAPEPEGCLAGLSVDEADLPGRISEARLVSSFRNRSVEPDDETALRALALARSLEEPIELADVLNYREERVEVCEFDRLAALDREDVLSSLALGAGASGPLLDLVADRHVRIRFEALVEQRVHLDEDAALLALAFAGRGGEVRLSDVLDIERSQSVKREVVRTNDLDRDEALDALALGRADDERAAPARKGGEE